MDTENGVQSLESSASGSTMSPPPSTPSPRKHPRHLGRGGPGHVPLHRRGTSHTYETMEDLLREAGYKETKVFTPENDKFGEGDKRGTLMDTSLNSVVGFISGLISGGTTQDEDEDDHEPQSPSTRKESKREGFAIGSRSLTSGSPGPRSRLRELPFRSGSPHSVYDPGYRGRYPSNSAAGNLLRHMASTPNIPRSSSSQSRVLMLNEPRLSRRPPPMPTTWLNNVREAVINSDAPGVHPGGPRERLVKRRNLQQDPARGRYIHRSKPLQPSALLTMRLATPGAVNMVNVVCRSAPGSRSSSQVRGSLAASVDIEWLEEQLSASYDRGRARKRGGGKGGTMPSLLAARVGDNVWNRRGESEDEDDEEDGELDLARILIPPKRQESIQSLRRHLGSTAVKKRGGLELWRPEEDD